MIKSVIWSSMIDYPDNVCTTLFTGVCNFDCEFCYNKGLLKEYPEEKIQLETGIYFVISLDVENYKDKKIARLERQAKQIAQEKAAKVKIFVFPIIQHFPRLFTKSI